MKKQFLSKAVPRGTRTIWRYLGALFILFTFAIGNVWANDYTLAASTFNSDKNAATVDGQTFTLDQAHGGTGQTGYSNYIKFSKNKTYVMTLPTGFTLTNINIKGYTNSNGKTDGAIAEIGGNSQSGKTFPAKDDSNLGSKTQITAGYDFAISQTGGTVAIKTANTNQICVLITITGTPAASGPVDPTITFNNGAYTVGDAALDLSSLFTSNSAGAVTYSVKTDGGTSASIDGTNFTATAAGTCVVTASQAAETGKYNAKAVDANIVVSAPAPSACPEGLSISGTAAYTEGETISLTAALEAGNGEITYTWYKGSIAAGNEVGTGASFSKASCATSDAGNYYCVASKDACPDAESTAYAVTVAEKVCPTSGVLYTMTMKSKSLSGVTQNTEIALAGDYATEEGGVSYIGNKNSDAGKAQIKTDGGGTVYFNGNDAYVKIVLDCPLKADDKITFVPGSGTRQVCFTTTNTRTDTYQTSSNTFTVSSAFLATAADPENVTTLYVWRIGSSTYLHSLTITRPYEITFANGGHGTVPSATTGFEIDLTQITGVEGWVHTGWTANKVVKVGGSDVAIGTAMAVDATAAVSDDTQFTAVWTEDIPAVDPTITFNNGAYTIGGTALDLSTLFSSNSTGAVTYTVKTDGGTNAAIDGTSFTASAAGTAVVTASQAAAVGYNAATADANIVVSAPSEPDGIKLVEAEALTGNYRTSCTLSSTTYTIAGLTYNKYIKFGSSVSSWSAVAGPSNKYLAFTPTKKTTNFYFYVHNNSSTASYINLYLIEEGNATPTKVQVPVAGSENALKTYELNITKNTEVYITAESNNVYYCQVIAVESGDALLQAPAVGYVMNLNKGRLSTASNTETTLEGLTFKLSSGYSIASGSNISIGTKGTHYVSFTIPTGQTRQLQLTTSNTAKYTVSKTLGDDANQITPVANEAKNFNLAAGTWYINPQGSNVNITNIAFAATPDPITVEFDSKGGSAVASQALFVGDKVTAPSPAPTKDGHRLLKWQKGGADYDFDTELVAGDAPGFTLDAVWQKTWKVTFDADNGSDLVVVTVDNNQAVAQPANPEKSGFDFVEWQLSGSAYDFATLVTGDITLTATWEIAQTDASLSALSYNGNAIDVNSAVDVSGVQTYTVHLQWGSTIDPALVSVTKNAETATVGSITYDSENNRISFAVESGNHSVLINYAIQFVIDAKRGTSIVKATTNNVVTGLIGGTIDQSYSGNANSRKLNKGNYFGVALANDETFQEGDVFIVNITTPADLGKFMIYADKDRTELIADQGIVYTKPNVASPVVCPTGEMMLVLPAAANGKKSLYLSRENVDNSEQWNVTFSYIEVTREMNPAIKSFKFGDYAATINESAKTITYEVAYGTDVTALTPTVEAYGNNGATYTPSGATDFTNPVVYTVTDAYNELHTDYTVTVNIAAPSTNAYLASLSVAGYALDFDKEVETYNIVLDYGTTVLPTITYEVEDAGLAEAVKVEDGVNGATTITVTPQAGESYKKVYTINFSVSTTPKFVIYDGQKSAPMAAIAESGSDVSTGFAWTITGASNTGASNGELSFEGKTYSKYVNLFTSATKAPGAGDTRYITITIPDGYFAKFRLVGCGNGNGSRSSFISKEITGTLDQSIVYATTTANNVLDGRTSALLLPGTYYYCADNSIRLYELSVQLYPIDYSRDVTEGRYGTICLPNGGVMFGATLYEVAYYGETSKKIFFDEVLNGEMAAGVPYIYLPNEGADKLAVFYTDEGNESAKSVNGLVGYIGASEDAADAFAVPAGEGNYILNNNQYRAVVYENSAYILSHRAYIKLAAINPTEPALAPGRRRISMSVQQSEVATDIDNLFEGEQPVKVMINGQLFIIRGEKMFDATGRLVK